MKICTYDGCSREVYAKGLCGSHYQKMRATGNPVALAKRREWYAKNKDHVKARAKELILMKPDSQIKRREYEVRNREHFNAKRRENYAANAVSKRFKRREWEAANPDKVKAMKQRHHAKHAEAIKAKVNEWVSNNPDKRRANVRNWDKVNADRCVANHAKRRATKLQATPSWSNEFFIKEAYHLARLRTKVTDIKWHVDHIVPLRSKLVCGLHVEQNLQVIPALNNRSKGNRVWPDMPLS